MPRRADETALAKTRESVITKIVLNKNQIKERKVTVKIAINEQKPEHFRVCWEGQCEVFSHFEFVCGILPRYLLSERIKRTENRMSAFMLGALFRARETDITSYSPA
jgi:hypothetical protein